MKSMPTTAKIREQFPSEVERIERILAMEHRNKAMTHGLFNAGKRICAGLEIDWKKEYAGDTPTQQIIAALNDLGIGVKVPTFEGIPEAPKFDIDQLSPNVRVMYEQVEEAIRAARDEHATITARLIEIGEEIYTWSGIKEAIERSQMNIREDKYA